MKTCRTVLLLGSLVWLGCGHPAAHDPDATTADPNGCNGHVELCDRAYDEVAYPTTHNAMSSEQDGWLVPNQLYDMRTQLDDGVRGLMLDAHYDGDEALLCHGFCSAGSIPLVDGLTVIRDFLEGHPREVITIIFESYVEAVDVAAAFADADLDGYAHAQDPGSPWPTLGELVDAGERLVVLTDYQGGDPAWYLPVWDHCFETPYHFESIDEMTCDPGRGDPANPLFIFNHFLTNPTAHPSFAEQINVNPFFVDRARECQAARGRLPNFVTVDFYSIGDLFAVVDTLNGVSP